MKFTILWVFFAALLIGGCSSNQFAASEDLRASADFPALSDEDAEAELLNQLEGALQSAARHDEEALKEFGITEFMVCTTDLHEDVKIEITTCAKVK